MQGQTSFWTENPFLLRSRWRSWPPFCFRESSETLRANSFEHVRASVQFKQPNDHNQTHNQTHNSKKTRALGKNPEKRPWIRQVSLAAIRGRELPGFLGRHLASRRSAVRKPQMCSVFAFPRRRSSSTERSRRICQDSRPKRGH